MRTLLAGLIAALATLAASHAAAHGDTVATAPSDRAQIAAMFNQDVSCLRIRFSDLDPRWARLVSRGKSECPAANGYVILRKSTREWRIRHQGSGGGPCPVKGVPTRIAREFRICTLRRKCAPVVRPYRGTKYDDVSLTRITAERTSCRVARRVARGAHERALWWIPASDGRREFVWRGWRIVGDLVPISDRYIATKGQRVVRWRF